MTTEMTGNFILIADTKDAIENYVANTRLQKYEMGIFKEMLQLIEEGQTTALLEYQKFGTSLRAIAMNVHAYRMGASFGFTELRFDQYGWVARPEWLNKEELTFGDTSRYGNYSTVKLGRGPNGNWVYALSYSFGCAGSGWGLSVYDRPFKNRSEAYQAALSELKKQMLSKVGSTDTTNDKQPVILATLRDIEKAEIGLFQLSLF